MLLCFFAVAIDVGFCCSESINETNCGGAALRALGLCLIVLLCMLILLDDCILYTECLTCSHDRRTLFAQLRVLKE